MCKKLMFLISLVALLSLANGTYGGDDFVWDGEGAGNSACELANWDLNETAVDPVSPPTASDDCKTDCKIADAGSMKAIHIASGCDIVCSRWYAPTRDGELNADQTFNMTGGTLTVYDRWRAIDGGPDRRADINISGDAQIDVISTDNKCTRWAANNPASPGLLCYVTIGDDAIVNVQPTVRSAEDGGYVNVDIGGEATLNVSEEIKCGEDGSGDWTFHGNASVNVGTAPAQLYTSAWGEFKFTGRAGNYNLNVANNAELWVRNLLGLGVFDAGAVYTADLTMTGGTINTGDLRLAGGLNKASTANISGGLVVVRGTLTAARGDGTATAVINLSGDAEMQVNSLSLQTNSVMDIDDNAQLILNGNVLAQVFALRDAGKLTACGGGMSPLQAAYDGGTNKTTVWADCTIPACASWSPTPLNTATEVAQTLSLLEWRAGQGMLSTDFHYIFISDDEACVTDAACGSLSAPCSRGWERGNDNFHDISDLSLDLWETYYWRVDEFTATCCEGFVWNFTTGCTLVIADINMDCVVNGLDYALLASTWMDEELWP